MTRRWNPSIPTKMIERTLRVLAQIPIYIFNSPFKLSSFGIHGFDKLNFHMYWAMPALGLFEMLSQRWVAPFLRPMFVFWLLAIVYSAATLSVTGIKSAVYCLAAVGFIQLLSLRTEKKHVLMILKMILGLTVATYIIQALTQTCGYKTLGSMKVLPMLEGPIGYANHTGFLLAFVALIFLFERKWWWYALTIAVVLPCISRTGIILIFMGSLIFLTPKQHPRWARRGIVCGLMAVMLYPFALWMVDHWAPDSWRLMANALTSSRYAIQSVYMDMFFAHPWGVGLNSSPLLFGYFVQTKGALFSILGPTLSEDPHNMWIRILVEVGIVGYLVWMLVFGLLLKTILKVTDARISLLFLLFCASMNMIDPTYNAAFYLFLAYAFWGVDRAQKQL